ncbi:MAG: hypothetical protein QM647_14995 [Asticcacaulis sp.]|uniref:hypothetical protein n=1 Tax=Asticcacaulis sp. TaxID=1872648 RepID=UPI0039E508F3
MSDPGHIVNRVRRDIKLLLKDGADDLQVYLCPRHYENLMALKGLPRSLAVLSGWGPLFGGRPLKFFGPHPLHFTLSGTSSIKYAGRDGVRREWKIDNI